MNAKIVKIGNLEVDVKEAQRRACRYHLAQAKREVKYAEENIKALAKLADAELYDPKDVPYDYSSVYLPIERKRVAAYAQALGVPVKQSSTSATKVNGRYRIKVYLRPEGYDRLHLTFLEKPTPEMDCKLVTVRTTSKQLVCNR